MVLKGRELISKSQEKARLQEKIVHSLRQNKIRGGAIK